MVEINSSQLMRKDWSLGATLDVIRARKKLVLWLEHCPRAKTKRKIILGSGAYIGALRQQQTSAKINVGQWRTNWRGVPKANFSR